MPLENILNGVGPLVILSAPLMLTVLLVRSTPISLHSRIVQRVAIVLALAVPIAFLVCAEILVLHGPEMTPFDFHVNYQAALAMYRDGVSPYSVQAAYSFPFPTFILYWLTSGFGRLTEAQTWIAWWLVNGAIWFGCALLGWRSLPPDVNVRGSRDLRRGVQIYALVAIPAMTTLWQGQTALMILAGLMAVQYALAKPGKHSAIVGGIGLAWAALVKPQLALVGLGLALWMIVRRDACARQIAGMLAAAVVAGLIGIGATLILPGGVTLDTYRQFIQETLPQVGSPAEQLTIGSPSFIAGVLALQFGASEHVANLITSGVTVLVLILAAFWTVRRANHDPLEIAAGWGVWAMVAPRIAWMWYATWCLPFFLLAIRQTRSPWRLALFVVALALVNLQLGSLSLALGTVLLLIGLLWTSFSPDFEYTGVRPLPSSFDTP